MARHGTVEVKEGWMFVPDAAKARIESLRAADQAERKAQAVELKDALDNPDARAELVRVQVAMRHFALRASI